MKSLPHVLLVEDSPTMAALYTNYLENEECILEHVGTGGEAMECLNNNLPNLLLLDLNLPDFHGMEILKHIHQHSLPVEVIVITANNSAEFAVEAIRLGAVDFLVKPFDGKRFAVTVRNVLKQHEMSVMLDTYRENFMREKFHDFIGTSLSMQSVYRIIESAATSRASIFITGESGTGKEVCAHAIHQQSERRDKPFIAINCAAIPKDLIESEIFGHVKGAFTGAATTREGAASRANGGTLFLDEICEMHLDLQSKILRFTQTGTFQKVGGSNEEEVDVRIVCATNRNPKLEVKEGRFREDLYFRLHVIPIELPPLRDREADALMIAENFLKNYSVEEKKAFKEFSADVRSFIVQYNWPGNVRELQNVIRQIVVLNDGDIVTMEMLPKDLSGFHVPRSIEPDEITANTDITDSSEKAEPSRKSASAIRPLWIEEKDVIERAIDACDGNIPKAATFLDISPSTIYRKKQSWSEK